MNHTSLKYSPPSKCKYTLSSQAISTLGGLQPANLPFCLIITTHVCVSYAFKHNRRHDFCASEISNFSVSEISNVCRCYILEEIQCQNAHPHIIRPLLTTRTSLSLVLHKCKFYPYVIATLVSGSGSIQSMLTMLISCTCGGLSTSGLHSQTVRWMCEK